MSSMPPSATFLAVCTSETGTSPLRVIGTWSSWAIDARVRSSSQRCPGLSESGVPGSTTREHLATTLYAGVHVGELLADLRAHAFEAGVRARGLLREEWSSPRDLCQRAGSGRPGRRSRQRRGQPRPRAAGAEARHRRREDHRHGDDIAWKTINAVRRPGSRRFTRGFLVGDPRRDDPGSAVGTPAQRSGQQLRQPRAGAEGHAPRPGAGGRDRHHAAGRASDRSAAGPSRS